MMHGFTLYVGNKDYFVVTDKKNKTSKLALDILNKMGLVHGGEDEAVIKATIKEVLYRTRKATCEIRPLGGGRQYYRIETDSSFCSVSEDEVVIINL